MNYRKSDVLRKRLKRKLALLVVLSAFIVVSVSIYKSLGSFSFFARKSSAKEIAKPFNITYPEKKIEVFDLNVKKEDTLYSILRDKDVDPEEILRIARISRKVYNLSRIKTGDQLKVTMIGGELDSIVLRYDELEGIRVKRDGSIKDGFTAENYEVPYTIQQRVVAGTIEDSLYESGLRAGINPRVITDISDIFAWDVDFATDIRKGDSFKVIYERIIVNGVPLRAGRIIAAEMTNKGKDYYALYYKDSKGRGEYYDKNARSVSRTLLRSPLSYRRISSHFSKRRYHPIHKKYRPHHGIDYAAQRGTPVESSGSGKIVYAGWKSGYGKYIKIRHNEKYTTAYGHLSKINKGIRKGARVDQGQMIGRVGSTGDSTGPHLHYEVLVRGRLVNPLSVKSKSRRTLAGDETVRFNILKEEYVARLDKAGVALALAE
ncbi:MAG: peptidoglycan DD-metalloendopeptidase family protein [Thermodesulfobacteriota bacterium]